MKIAVFIKSTTHHKGFGGLETLNKTLCEGLANRGHKVVVFSPKREFTSDNAREAGVDYVFIESVYRTLFQFTNKNNWYNKSLEVFRNYHEKEKFDLVVSQSTAGISIIKNKLEFEVKAVGISHGSIISELRTRFDSLKGIKDLFYLAKDTVFALDIFFGRQRDYVFGCDKVVTVSNFVKKTLIEETYCPEEKIEVIHNGTDFGNLLAKLSDIKKEGSHFLHIGRIYKEKGVDMFPALMTLPEFKEFYLDLVGSGEYLETLKNDIRRLGAKNINVLGKIPYEETVGWFAKSDVFLFPTRRLEGFPMVLIEAMFAGLPVVAYDMGGVSDAVIDGETGFLVKPGDFDTFKDRAYKLMSDQELRAKMSQNAVDKARNEFTLEIMLDKYESLFKGLLLL